MGVHMNAQVSAAAQAQEGELSLTFLKKYIGFIRKYVYPRWFYVGILYFTCIN